MKQFVIRVIKRKTQADTARILPTERRMVQTVTVTNTVKNWIAESRKNRLDKDNASLETIAGWTAEAQT